jgi:putative Ca2+/H+ antiporter (TMEM165/GDT1 family)
MQTSFILSFLMIMVSENGDKTFLITAILAMKHSRMVVFAGAFASMLIMSVFSTLFSTLVGRLIPTYLLSKTYTDFCAALLFLIVGLHMLHEALYMEDDENDEMEEAECEVNALEARKLEELEVGGKTEYSDNAAAKAIMSDHAREGLMNLIQLLFSPVFVKTFALTFVGELGDCSQISTIALAAANVCIYYCLSHNLLP